MESKKNQTGWNKASLPRGIFILELIIKVVISLLKLKMTARGLIKIHFLKKPNAQALLPVMNR